MAHVKDEIIRFVVLNLDYAHQQGLSISSPFGRAEIASRVVERLFDEGGNSLYNNRRRYRSGRRIADILRDKLLDMRKWVSGGKQP